MWNTVHQGYYELVDPYPTLNPYYMGYVMGPAQYSEMDNAIYRLDEFRMYVYKVKRCTRMRSHDWTQCPYAHGGEKAQRRDPRRYNYEAIICPSFRAGRCLKGDLCGFSHGVFEYWLHPDKYRTRACNAKPYCPRRVCFFAHTPEELRPEPPFLPKYYIPRYHHQQQHCPPYYPYPQKNMVYPKVLLGGGRINGGGGGMPAAPTAEEYQTMLNNKKIVDESVEKVESFLNSLRALKLSDDAATEYENEAWKKSEVDATSVSD